MDLAEYGVVDSHCHAFLPERETDSFEQYLTLADHPIPKEDVVNTFLYRQVIRELSQVLGVEGTHEDVVNERHVRYKQDPEGYINMLFEDAKIDVLLVDTGYPSKDYSGYSVDLEAFSGMVPSEVREIFRIENLALTLLREGLPLDSMVEEFNTHINNAVKNGAVALKSVIAYRTGLDVKRRTIFEVKKSLQEVSRRTGIREGC